LTPAEATAAPAAQPAAAPAAPVAPAQSAAPTPATAAPEAAPAAPEPEVPKWLSQVSPELRANKELYRFGSLNDAAKELIAKAEAKGRVIELPDPEKATKEDMSAFRAKLGIPDNADGYEIDLGKLKDIPEVGKLADLTKKIGEASGLTRKQAQRVFEGMASSLVGEARAKQESLAEAQAGFDKAVLDEVGGDAGKADAYKNLYKAALVRFNDAQFVKVLADTGKLYDPKFAKMMATMEVYMGADQLPVSETRPSKPKADAGPHGAFGKSYGKQWETEGRTKK